MNKNKRILVVSLVSVLVLSIGVAAFVVFRSISGKEISTDSQSENSEGHEVTEDIEVENYGIHEDPDDYIWDSSDVIPITLDSNSITIDGDGATADGSRVTITSAGTYSLSGVLDDGQVIVDSADKDVVRLILEGVDISNSTSAPIFIKDAEKTIIILADDTQNHITDADSYILEDSEGDEPNAAIFSKDNLTIYGNGSLTVDANYNDGIASKDGLIIKSGVVTVDTVDDGIRGKDYLVVKDGNITVNAEGDGLKSDEDENTARGYISIETGIIKITSGGDAVTAQTDVTIDDGIITLSSGGGSNASISSSTSAKGIKADVNLVIEKGTFTIDSADDALHSNDSLTINGGTYDISTGDDGIHADSEIVVNNGDITINESFEGIESAVIKINGGDIHIISSDDGLNVAGGNDGSGMEAGPRGPGMGPGRDDFAVNSDYYLYINGGHIALDALGDGIDVNGTVEMTDGVLIINGPISDMNGALDYGGSFKISGGFLVAAGSAGMAQAPDTSSSQYSLLVNLSASQQSGTLFHIQTSGGEEILTFMPTKSYQSITFSSPELAKGTAYNVYLGGSSTGAVADSLYNSGNYTPGSKYTNFTISSILTTIGNVRDHYF